MSLFSSLKSRGKHNRPGFLCSAQKAGCGIYLTHLPTVFFTVLGYTAIENRACPRKMKGKDPHAVASNRPPGWIGIRGSHAAACPLFCPPVTERPDAPADHHASRRA